MEHKRYQEQQELIELQKIEIEMLQKEKQAALEKEKQIKQLQQEVQAMEQNLKNSEDNQ